LDKGEGLDRRSHFWGDFANTPSELAEDKSLPFIPTTFLTAFLKSFLKKFFSPFLISHRLPDIAEGIADAEKGRI
jgi:hypothetical protein